MERAPGQASWRRRPIVLTAAGWLGVGQVDSVCGKVPGGGRKESGPHILEMALLHLLYKLIRMITTGVVLEFQNNNYLLLSPYVNCLI